MKKIILLFAFGCLATGSFAQQRHHIITAQAPISRTEYLAPPNLQKKSFKPIRTLSAKTTATTFWGPETFGSGTTTTLPSGWTANSMPTTGGGTWKWANTASTSPFTMGAMSSTTASDGWMIFDSDLLGIGGGTPSGYLQSPAITACATESSVRVNFENYYRNFYDSCSVWVCTNASFTPGTYSVFPVYYNNATPVNVSTPNTSVVRVNISAAAALQPTVYIRFVYYGYAGGSYSWMIDDVTLSSMDPVDAGLSKSSALYFSGPTFGWAAFGAKPAKMMDTVYPVTYAANYGTTAFPSATVNAKIFQTATSVYDNNVIFSLPVDALDTIVDFVAVGTPPGYFSTTTALYTVPFSINLTGDADVANNNDTAMFRVTDTSWATNAPNANSTGSQYVYRSSPPSAYSPGTGFTVTAGRTDTLTSVSVAFADTTAAGQSVGVQIYHFDGTNWVYDGVTVFKALTDAEISTSTSLIYANFPVDYAASAGHIVLQGGTDGGLYAAVVKGMGNTAEVAVLTTTPPAPDNLVGGSAYSDTSYNDGAAGQQFGQTGLPSGNAAVPRITLNFGAVPTIGIKDINAASAIFGKAYPNPANTTLNIPFTLARDGEVKVTLANVVGQVVAAQSMQAIGGQQAKVSFDTKSLSTGMYIYTVSVDGKQTTGKITITH